MSIFKNRKTHYGRLLPKNMEELKLWDTVHIDLIGTYSKSIRQQQPGVAAIKSDFSLTCMIMIEPAMGWFEIVNVPVFDLI